MSNMKLNKVLKVGFQDHLKTFIIQHILEKVYFGTYVRVSLIPHLLNHYVCFCFEVRSWQSADRRCMIFIIPHLSGIGLIHFGGGGRHVTLQLRPEASGRLEVQHVLADVRVSISFISRIIGVNLQTVFTCREMTNISLTYKKFHDKFPLLIKPKQQYIFIFLFAWWHAFCGREIRAQLSRIMKR